jgi:hypothetical protein
MTLVNGITTIQGLDGSQLDVIPGNLVISAGNVITLNNKQPFAPEQAVIIESLYNLQIAELAKSMNAPPANLEWMDINNPLAKGSVEIADKITTDRLTELLKLKSKIYEFKQIKQKRQRQQDRIRSNSERSFGSFLEVISQEILDVLLDEVNRLLPSEAQINFDVTFEGDTINFSGLSVGPLQYNKEDNTITINGEVYNAVAQQGLDVVNDLLPDYLNINLTPQSIGLGNIVVDLDTLQDNPNQRFPLSDTVQVEFDGDKILTWIGEQSYHVGSAVALNYISQGLDSLNQILPSGLETSISFIDGDPVLGLGPASFNIFTGEFNIDSTAVTSFVTNIVDSKVFSQLPAPLARIARAAWRSIPFMDIFTSTPTDIDGADTLTIYQTDQGFSSGTPAIQIPRYNLPAQPSKSVQDADP